MTHLEHRVMRLCLVLHLKVRSRVVQNVLLQNVLAGRGLFLFLKWQATSLWMASKSWDNAFSKMDELAGFFPAAHYPSDSEALTHTSESLSFID